MVPRNGARGSAAAGWRVGLALALFGATIVLVGTKVELAEAARDLGAHEQRCAALVEQRERLSAAIVYKRKPGAIEAIARGRLGMDYTGGRLSELSFRQTGELGAE